MRIGEFSTRSGLPVSTLRYYERAGVLPKPPRRNGKRVYDRADLPIARILRTARDAKLPIVELRVLSMLKTRGEVSAWLLERARRADAEITLLRQRRDWLVAAAACGCAHRSACELLGSDASYVD